MEILNSDSKAENLTNLSIFVIPVAEETKVLVQQLNKYREILYGLSSAEPTAKEKDG